MTTPPLRPKFFSRPEVFRKWLRDNHARKTELWVGFYKKGSRRKSITWQEAVDEALCFGWIDGIRRSVDSESYTNRFTPRRPTSTWSAVNRKRMAELIAEGRVQSTGLAAFEKRRPDKTGIYSYENRARARLDAQSLRVFRSVPGAWKYFSAQPPSYRTMVTWWVVSAKRPETRERRLGQLIEFSRKQEWIPGMRKTSRAEPE